MAVEPKPHARAPRTSQKRLEELERFAIQHGESLSAFSSRMSILEDKQRLKELNDVREEGQWTAIMTKLTSLEIGTDKRLGRIEGLGSKALWVFISAIILAFAAFLIRGGMA